MLLAKTDDLRTFIANKKLALGSFAKSKDEKIEKYRITSASPGKLLYYRLYFSIPISGLAKNINHPPYFICRNK
jgi:hypothetical protein